MKGFIDVLIVLAVLALVGARVVWWVLRDDDPSIRDPAGRPQQKDPSA